MNTVVLQNLSREDIIKGLWAAREELEAERQKAIAAAGEATQPESDAPAAPEAAPATPEAESAPAANTDPLMSSETTAGLEKLLSQWDIFESSGIFGFGGKSGIENDTYKKIAGLDMQSVMTGRFEDADKVSASIMQYVDGWKREQHVVPEDTETFEMYLRRVVNAILTKRATVQEQVAHRAA